MYTDKEAAAMKLNLDTIRKYLPEGYQTRRYGSVLPSGSYTRPLLYENAQPLSDGALYIAYAEALPKSIPAENCGFIAVGSRIPAEWTSGGIQLLTVENTDNVREVFNTIQILYNGFDQWEEQLRDELEKEIDFDIRKILELGSAKLNRNITVMNYMLLRIFRSEIQTGSNGKRKIVVDDRPETMSIDYSEMIKEVCNLERIITVPYMSAVESDSCQYYCCNTYMAGRFAGCTSIDEGTTPFEEGDFAVMDYFFAVFQKAYTKYQRSYAQEDFPESQALRKLLDHIPLTPDENALFRLQPGEQWAFFRLKERRKGKNLPKDYMYASLNGINPKTAYAMVYHEEIVGLLRLGEKEKGETITTFEQTLHRMGYYGGLSHSFTDMTRLKDYFRQAGYAVQQGGETEGVVHYFKDFVLSYMLSACRGELSGESLLSDGLLALREHDRKKGTDYVNTLDLYLQNEMSITKTSQALFIHRSSLLKRLEKITKLSGCDFSDSDIRLYYRLCLALMKEK